MIDHQLDTADAVLLIHPRSALAQDDFVKLAKEVDPQIEAHGDLAGIILDVQSFPGWENFGALVSHLRFVRDHHKHVRKIAVVTDSPLGDIAERLASHFVSATIKHFPGGQVEAARQWITTDS